MVEKPIRIPEIPADADAYTAALALAGGGLYVLPIRQGTKHPGSILGKDWPSQSTISAADIHCLWREDWPKAGVGIHAGRSGLVVIDIDDPAALPDVLRSAIQDRRPPFQVTRELPLGLDVEIALDVVALRGHALFRVPPGRILGNSLGKLGKGWGDIRGANGFIVTVPTRHEEPDGDPPGRYRWVRTGRVPELPETVACLLPDGGDHETVATDAQVKAFKNDHTVGSGKRAMAMIENAVKRFTAEVAKGGGRHTEAVAVATWMAREAAAGMYPAGLAFSELWRVFDKAVSGDRGARNKSANLRAEFDGIVAWAVGQAMASPEQVSAVRDKLNLASVGGYVQPSLLEPEPVEVPATVVVPEPPDEPAWMRPEGGDAAAQATQATRTAAVRAAGATVSDGGADNRHDHDDHDGPPPGGIEVLEFWGRRKVLDHIWRYAVARYTSPWAVLGVVLARVLAATSPVVQLPAIVGGYGSLNLLVALVAPSGGGKGGADAVGAEALEIHRIDSGVTTGFERHSLGSGEGLAHMFMRRPRPTKADPDPAVYQYNVAALVAMSEVDTFGALNSRQGSTLAGQLRQAAMGEQLGFFYVDRDKRMQVPAHTYRLCLVAGVQPRRARVLLDDADGGTPQRFLWLPADDLNAPEEADLPECPVPLLWMAPDWPVADAAGRATVPLPDAVVTHTKELRRAHLRRQGNPLDGHANLTRLKVATALAILDERAEVSDEDWELSGMVMAKSDETRGGITDELSTEARERVQAQGFVEAEKQMAVVEHVDSTLRRRASGAVLRRLAEAGGDGWMSEGELRRKAASAHRPYLEDVLEALTASGQVVSEAVEYRGQSGIRYKLGEIKK
jgi:hypothetical protein